MAVIRSNSGLDLVFDAGRTFIHQKMHHVKQALARREVYRATVFELSQLSDRQLKDLGMVRSGIKRRAMESAYDV